MDIQDEFISTVSHELRTPLTSIRGFAQTLLASWDKIDEENKKKFIKIIEDQSNRLINLVENILTVTKSGSSVFTKVDINSSVKKVVPILKEAYKSYNIELILNAKPSFARLDEDKFQQVMTNLIDNGCKYSPEGSTVKITTESEGNYIKISVQDEGVGIKECDRDKLFKRFSRLENHLTSKTQGNGLGLYITKQIVENMQGKIDFISDGIKGTTFTVIFPVYNEEEAMKCLQKS